MGATSTMSPAAALFARQRPRDPRPTTRWSRGLKSAILVLVGLLLVQVLFEGWAQTLFGGRHTDSAGAVVLDPPSWPKTLKNGLYLTLAVVTLLTVIVEHQWRRFRTPADLALVVLGALMLLSGLVGGSSPSLMGEALFVYFRGVIIFYGLRAAAPSIRKIRPLFWIVIGIVALNVVIALVQMVVGKPAFTGLGWTELKWADTNRAHALLNHPNHLGHLLSLTSLGALAWLVTRERVRYGWWLLFAALALALSATQSRESVAAVSIAAGVIWLVARAGGRRVLAAVLVIWVFTSLQIAIRPSNRAEWERRLTGVVDAFRVPSGEEHSPSARPTPKPYASPAPTLTSQSPSPSTSIGAKDSSSAGPRSKTPARETRVLFYQQGLKLFARSPLLGYGPGQFGGIVAEKNNPNWHQNPAFGPKGFDRHGFKSQQLDTFWLHLLVEVGALGFLAYLAWLWFLLAPLGKRLRRRTSDDRTSRVDPLGYFAIAAMVFAVQVAFFSASLEDPMLPAVLFAVLGVAWVARPATADTPVLADGGAETSATPQ